MPNSTESKTAWLRQHIVGWRRTTQALAISFWLAIALLVTPSSTYKLNVGPGTFIAIAVLAITLTLVRWLASEYVLGILTPRFPSLARPSLRPTKTTDTGGLADQYFENFLNLDFDLEEGLIRSLGALVNPSTIVHRITQRMTSNGRRWNVNLSRTLATGSEPILFAVHRVRKGVTTGDLQISVDEKRISTLSFAESKGLLLAIVDVLWAGLFRDTRGHLPKPASDMLTVVNAGIVKDAELDVEAFSDIIAGTKQLIARDGASQEDLELLIFVIRLALAYDIVFISIAIPAGSKSCRVAISYDILSGGMIETFVDRFRAAMGVGQRNYQFPIPYVTDSRSFHLNVVGPQGMYAYHAAPLWPASARASSKHLDPDSSRQRDQAAILSTPSGDETTHLYMRDFDGRPVFDRDVGPGPKQQSTSWMPQFAIEFREVPPGLISAVTGVALWLTTLTWVVGIFHDVVFKPGSGTAVGSWPTLIFGVPALVTGWLLSRASMQTIRVISIPTLLTLLWLAANSALIVAIVALKSSGIESSPTEVVMPFIGPQVVSHPTWTVLMISMFLNLATSASMWLTKSTRFASIINGRG